MKEVGIQLRAIREEKGFSLEDVQKATKIRAEFIGALENSDLDALPGRVYGIGFARTYAKFLGLDENEIVAIYKTYYNETEAKKNAKKVEVVKDNKAKNFIRNGGIEKIERTEINFDGQPIKTRRTNFGAKFSWLVLILFIVILGIILFNMVNVSREDADKVSLVELATSETVNNNIVDAAEITHDENANVVIRLEVDAESAESCWINVIIDSKEYLTTKIDPGQDVTLSGDKQISVQYNQAKAVSVVFKNTRLGVVDEVQDNITVIYNKDGIVSEKLN
ncbi:MAG: helix-turn-helix domain-containing protein [Bacillota bacterium]